MVWPCSWSLVFRSLLSSDDHNHYCTVIVECEWERWWDLVACWLAIYDNDNDDVNQCRFNAIYWILNLSTLKVYLKLWQSRNLSIYTHTQTHIIDANNAIDWDEIWDLPNQYIFIQLEKKFWIRIWLFLYIRYFHFMMNGPREFYLHEWTNW